MITIELKHWRPNDKIKPHETGDEALIYISGGPAVTIFTHNGQHESKCRAFTLLKADYGSQHWEARLDRQYHRRWFRRLASHFGYAVRNEAERLGLI